MMYGRHVVEGRMAKQVSCFLGVKNSYIKLASSQSPSAIRLRMLRMQRMVDFSTTFHSWALDLADHLPQDEYILTGKIDLIAGQNDTVELIDFKSERKLDVNDPKDRDKLARYRRQLEVYAHIVQERTGQAVSRTHLYYTGEESGNPYISFPADPGSIDRTIAAFDAVVGRIETKDFAIPERPAKLCRDCDMRFYCDLKNWKFSQGDAHHA